MRDVGTPDLVKRRDIQGIRGIAVLLVVFFHVGLPIPGGFVGVDIFFVLSGFVITRLLWAELLATGRLRLRNFYARRVRRLLPALALLLVFVAFGGFVLYTPLGLLQQMAQTGISAALFLANAMLFRSTGGYFDTANDANPLLHTWTLAVEEQFYVIFPFVLLLGWRLRVRVGSHKIARAVVPLMILVVLGLSFTASLYLTYGSGPPFGLGHNRSFAFYASPSRAWEFAAGALLALAEQRLPALGRLTAQALGALGVCVMVAAVFLINGTTAFPGLAALTPVVATVCLILAGSIKRNFVTSLLGVTWLTWLGDLSYGWYLWHWPVIVFTRALKPDPPVVLLALVAALSLILAWLSSLLLEDRIRFDRTFSGWRAVRLAAVCCLVPVAAFGAVAASANFPSVTERQLQVQARPHLDLTQGCTNDLPETSARFRCTWTVPNAKGTIVLIGDSNAGHFAEPVRGAAKDLGYNFQLATDGGCPFAALQTKRNTPFDVEGCQRFIVDWVDFIGREKPKLVILANSSSSYVRPANGMSFTDSVTHRQAVSGEDKAVAWEVGIKALVSVWTREGIPVLIVHSVPQFANVDLRECTALQVNRSLAECGRKAVSARLALSTKAAVRAENGAVAGNRLASTLDLFKTICPDTECSTYRDGQFLYRDGAHLSVPFATSLKPRFLSAIQLCLGGLP